MQPSAQTRDPRFVALVHDAMTDLQVEIDVRLPMASPAVHAWMAEIATASDPAADQLDDTAFPTLALAWWLDEALAAKAGSAVDPTLHHDLIGAALAADYALRMTDDVAHGRARARLLPALGFFHERFLTPYARRFGTEGTMWTVLHDAWADVSDVAIGDEVARPIDQAAHDRLATRRVGMARIPMTAVALRHGRPSVPPGWTRVARLMSRWHQLYTDLRQWSRDLEAGETSYIAFQAKRRARRGETVAAWMAREGVEWFVARLEGWMRELQTLAASLDSAGLSACLEGWSTGLQGFAQTRPPAPNPAAVVVDLPRSPSMSVPVVA